MNLFNHWQTGDFILFTILALVLGFMLGGAAKGALEQESKLSWWAAVFVAMFIAAMSFFYWMMDASVQEDYSYDTNFDRLQDSTRYTWAWDSASNNGRHITATFVLPSSAVCEVEIKISDIEADMPTGTIDDPHVVAPLDAVSQLARERCLLTIEEG